MFYEFWVKNYQVSKLGALFRIKRYIVEYYLMGDALLAFGLTFLYLNTKFDGNLDFYT